MEDSKWRYLRDRVEKILDFMASQPDDKVVIVLRFEGKELRDVDLQRYLSRPD